MKPVREPGGLLNLGTKVKLGGPVNRVKAKLGGPVNPGMKALVGREEILTVSAKASKKDDI